MIKDWTRRGDPRRAPSTPGGIGYGSTAPDEFLWKPC